LLEPLVGRSSDVRCCRLWKADMATGVYW